MANTPKLMYDKSPAKDMNTYQKDALYLTEAIRQGYPRWETKIAPEVFEKEKQKLLNDLSGIHNDVDFEIRLQSFIALLRDGHSAMLVDYYTDKQARYPVALFRDKEGWLIVNIDRLQGDSTWIGSRLVSVNQVPISELEERARKFESSENRYRTGLLFAGHISSPVFCKAIGLIALEGDKLDFVVNKDGEEKSFALHPANNATGYRLDVKEPDYPFTRKQNNGFYYRTDREADYAYLQMNTSLDYLTLKKEMGSYTNVIVRPFALSYLKKQNKHAMNFGVVLQSLFREIHEKGIGNLVIDLRYNSGGDERLGKQLIWYLNHQKDIKGFTTSVKICELFKRTVKLDYKRYNALYREKYGKTIPDGEINLNDELLGHGYFDDIMEKDSPYLLDQSIPKFNGKVYVLIGNHTFSAGQMLTTTIADNRLATLVGQPSGNKPTTQTGYSQFKLPNTKKIVTLSYMYMERPDKSKDAEDSVYPDVEFPPDFGDVLEGKDVSFEYILSEIKK